LNNVSNKCLPILVVGKKNCGKTSYLKFLVERLQKLHLKAGGFLCINQSKQKYFLTDIKSGEKRLFASEEKSPKRNIKYGIYYFDPDAFTFGSFILRNSLDAAAIFLDEFGPLEKNGSGFRSDLEFLLKNYTGFLFIAVRPSLLTFLYDLLKKF
jgi:nucleoside-triphosphatase THEP1